VRLLADSRSRPTQWRRAYIRGGRGRGPWALAAPSGRRWRVLSL